MENTIITINMSMEKATKNCVKFTEIMANEFMPEKLGSLYIQKSALAEIGYIGGNICIKLCANMDAESADMLTGIAFNPDKPTKNTVKFAEVVESEWVPEKIGSLYIPKVTLAELKWNPGTSVMAKIELAK